MTGRDVAVMALEGERPPRTPVGLIAGGEWYVYSAGKTFNQIKHDPDRIADVFVQAHERIGQDLLWTGAGLLNYPIHCLGCPIEDHTSDSPKLTGTVIRDLDGLAELSIEKVTRNPTMQAITGSHHVVADRIGKETLVMSTQWGPLTVAARILGTEALMMASVENPEKLRELIRFATEMIWAVGEPALDHPDVLGMNISDPVASVDMISPVVFRSLVAPFLKELVDRIHARGKYAGIHICGNTTPILGEILDIGPTCFSLESKVDLRRARETLGGRVCVLGNVSPTGAFLSGTPDEVKAEGRDCIRAWGEEKGFILTVGCDFPKGVPLQNILALMSLKGSV